MVPQTDSVQEAASSVAQTFSQRVHRYHAAGLVDLSLFCGEGDWVVDLGAAARAQVDHPHPLYALYLGVVSRVAASVEEIGYLPELKGTSQELADAQVKYAPESSPSSALSRSYFENWKLFDFPVGSSLDTLGQCVAAAARACGANPEYLAQVEALCRSRPGLYVHEGQQGDRVVVRELVTQERREVLIPSGYRGAPGDLLLLRLAVGLGSESDPALALAKPYQIIGPGLTDWQAYLDRVLPSLGSDRRVAYERLMKRGVDPQGPRYWLEYILDGYVDDAESVVFLHGLPDLPESLPRRGTLAPAALELITRHFQKHGSNSGPGRRVPPTFRAAQNVAQAASPELLGRLPKLALTLQEFGSPLLQELPANASLDQLQAVLDLVVLLWNTPIIEQHLTTRDPVEHLDTLGAGIAAFPESAQVAMHAMLRARVTTYALDPRLAVAKVRDHGDGDLRVYAEGCLLGAQ